MTKKPKRGTLSTSKSSDKKTAPQKEADVAGKMKALLGVNKVRYTKHANERMWERNVVRAEVAQALSGGKHIPKQDRFNEATQSWAYSFEGKTHDNRLLRIGISFEQNEGTGEIVLIVTVIDLEK